MSKITFRRKTSVGLEELHPKVQSRLSYNGIMNEKLITVQHDRYNDTYVYLTGNGVKLGTKEDVKTDFDIADLNHVHTNVYNVITPSNYSSGTTYYRGDFVKTQDDSTWEAIYDTGFSGVEPGTNAEFWELVAITAFSLPQIIDKKVPLDSEGFVTTAQLNVENQGTMRYAGSNGFAGSEATPRTLAQTFSDVIDFTSEQSVKESVGKYKIMSVDTWMEAASLDGNWYKFNSAGFDPDDIDDDQEYALGDIHLEEGDWVVLDKVVVATEYTFYFSVINNNYTLADTDGIRGIVSISDVANDRSSLNSVADATKVMSEYNLRGVMRDIVGVKNIYDVFVPPISFDSNLTEGTFLINLSTDGLTYDFCDYIISTNTVTSISVETALSIPDTSYVYYYNLNNTYYTCTATNLDSFYFIPFELVDDDLVIEYD